MEDDRKLEIKTEIDAVKVEHLNLLTSYMCLSSVRWGHGLSMEQQGILACYILNVHAVYVL